MNKEELILKWLNDELSPEELKALQSMDDYESYLKIVEHAAYFKNDQKVDLESGFRDIEARLSNQPKVISLQGNLRKFSRIAAVIAVLVTGYLFFNRQSTVNIVTRIAEQQEIILPDASEAFLNAQSQLTYHPDEWENERSLTLEGEAFFKVEKGSAFKVQTPVGWVRVLGTQFNVFSRDSVFSVSCYEGAVKVGVNSREIILKPGDAVQVVHGKMVARTNKTSEPMWLKGQSTFESIPLVVVLEEIERQYGIRITTEKGLDQNFYTGVFPHDDLNEALKSVCQPFGLQFDINGKNVKVSPVNE